MHRLLAQLLSLCVLGALIAGTLPCPDARAEGGASSPAVTRRKKKKRRLRTAPLVLDGSLTITQILPDGQITLSWKGHLERRGGEGAGPVKFTYGPGIPTTAVSGRGSGEDQERKYEWQAQKGSRPPEYIAPDQVSLYLSGKTSGSTAQLSITSWILFNHWTLHKPSGSVERRSETGQVHWPAWDGPKVPLQAQSNGTLSVNFKNFRYVQPHTNEVFLITGRLQGKGGWDLDADAEIRPLENGAASFSVQARDLPGGAAVQWSGDLGQQSGGGNSIRVRYTRPGIYHVTATYKPRGRARESQTVSLYVVDVKLRTPGATDPGDPGRLIRDEKRPELPSSVPPGKFRKLLVEVRPDLTGSDHVVSLDVVGTTGGVSGGGRVEPAEVRKDGELRVYGVEQTESGRGPELRVRARIEGEKKDWRSEPFAVCAHTNAIENSFWGVLRGNNDGGHVTGVHWGPVWELKARRGAHSDSDYWWDQDEVELKETITPIGGTKFWESAPMEVGPWVSALRTDPPIRDRHSITGDNELGVLAKLRQVADQHNGDLGQQIANQVILFRCKRCGAGMPDGIEVERSGFRIEKRARRTRTGFSPVYELTVRKVPFPVGSVLPGIIQDSRTGPFPVTIP